MCDDFGEGESSRGGFAIKVAFDEVKVRSESAQPFVGGAISEIA
jgi:hypothetical protein